MQGPFWRMISSLCVPLRISASIFRNAFLGLLGAFLLLVPLGARADVYQITLFNATFTTTCIGGGTCSEIVNGFGQFDSIADTVSNASITLTGSLNASLVYGTPPQCTVPGCLTSPILYDSGVLPGFNPIEVDISISNFDAPTPQPLDTGMNGTLLFVPGSCGGDQPLCNTTGAFPGNGAMRYTLTSGTYTSVDLTPTPEPGSAILLVTGVLGLLAQRSFRKIR